MAILGWFVSDKGTSYLTVGEQVVEDSLFTQIPTAGLRADPKIGLGQTPF